jgi:hypothetical protein
MKKIFSLFAAIALIGMAAASQASNELFVVDTTGQTEYAVVLNRAGQSYAGGNAFATTTNTAYLANKIVLTEQGTTGIYTGSFPAAITSGGEYPVVYARQAGGTAATTDPKTGTSNIEWTGTALDTLYAHGVTLAALPTAAGNIAALGTQSQLVTAFITGLMSTAINGVKFSNHIGNTSAVVWGGSTPSVSGNTTTFAFALPNGTTYVTSAVTKNPATGAVTTKIVSVSNQN